MSSFPFDGRIMGTVEYAHGSDISGLPAQIYRDNSGIVTNVILAFNLENVTVS